MALLQDYKVLFEQNTEIKEIFYQGQRIWPSLFDSKTIPFYVRNMESTSIEFPIEPGYAYSIVKGEWIHPYESSTETLAPGAKMLIMWDSQPRTSIDSFTFPWPSSNPRINIGGNIMSLLDGNDFVGLDEVGSFAFFNLFRNKAIDIDDLVLPATTLASYCYSGMFWNCTSLTNAPELPATILSSHCYDTMFQSCTSLTAAPALPATTLASYCYSGMFMECTSLTTAPVLPATTLVNSCYANMFRDDDLLSSVTCLATSGINTDNSTTNWVSNVAATGTFTKAAGATWPTGVSGIPSGWTVVEV